MQLDAAARIRGRGHRDRVAGQPHRLRHRLASRLVRPVPAQLRPRAHTERPRPAAGPRPNQDRGKRISHLLLFYISLYIHIVFPSTLTYYFTSYNIYMRGLF